EQIKLRDRIIEENISVRETEEIIRDRNKAGKVNPARKEQESSAQVKLNAERLRDHFATKVKIKQNGQKGKIELEYYSQEDFNRIFSLLIK
ncbi:chromosome partitioning protein ParB, partial [bacterium]|nr:chromosome partitioning protein ParB [bacterium]